MSGVSRELEDITDAEMTVSLVRGKEGGVHSIEQLKMRIYQLGIASGETSAEDAAQLQADLVTTLNRFYPLVPPYVSNQKVPEDMPAPLVDERRKNEYRPEVDRKIGDLLMKPDLTLREIASSFMSKEINPTSAFHILMFIGDAYNAYKQREDAKEKTDDLFPKHNMNMVVGLIRAFEPDIYNKYRDTVQGLRKPRTYGAPEKTPLKS
jgi:hypothetical protein